MQGKIAVLGNSDFVMPFSALGLDTFRVSDERQSIVDGARKILEEKYPLVIVAENVAPKAEQVFSAVRQKTLPAVLVVPFTTESQGFATRSLGQALKMAMGINVLQSN
ncbi:MAG: V-type ATP synthase subunit F [Phycisphaerae bacterium]|jgi:vacuolar-type H+-ATPase subunit F/Vma7